MSFGTSITELPSLVWNMIRNKVFMIVTLTSCSEFSIVVAFLTFMPKYIQDQFSIDPSKVKKQVKTTGLTFNCDLLTETAKTMNASE